MQVGDKARSVKIGTCEEFEGTVEFAGRHYYWIRSDTDDKLWHRTKDELTVLATASNPSIVGKNGG